MKNFCILFLLLATSVTAQEKKNILIFGDSITAGFGIEPQQAFPALIQDRIDSLGLNFNVINAGLSGETSAGGLRRIDWVLQRTVDVMILELGGNDALRGIDLSTTKENLQKIIDKVLAKYPEAEIVVAGMQVPPNLGTDYTQQFASIFPELAKKNELLLIPFLLEKVGGSTELNQSDGIHPTAKGHALVAETVWEYLYPVIKNS
tara:strand:- start:6995 stop:7609 length:615 start_codon:yes stop_codon:yes gene_type:complete